MTINLIRCHECPASYSSHLTACPRCGTQAKVYAPKVETQTREEITAPTRPRKSATTNTAKVNHHKRAGNASGEFFQSTMHRKGE